MTAWFIQKVGLEYRALKYKAGRRIKVGEFVAEIKKDQPEWNIDTWFLPHDAESEQLAADGGNVQDLFKAAGCKTAIVPKIPSDDYGIRKVRDILPSVWFDEDECADGITALRHYRFAIDEKTKEFSRTPKHDEASHGAKGFEGFAVSAGIDYSAPVVNLKPPTDYQPRFNSRGTGWMSRM